MISRTIEELKSAVEEITSAFKKGSAVRKELQTRFEKQIVAGDVGAVAKCVDRFVQAELDFETPGDRGIGRASASVPRLGAYFRKELKQASAQVREEIAGDIRGLIWRGYLCSGLLSEPFVRSGVEPAERLFNDWIPRIYSVTPTENLWGVATSVATPALERLIEDRKSVV